MTTPPALLTLALQSALFAVLTNGYRVVDQYWIQDVSVEAQGAVGASFFVIILYYAAFELIAAGTSPLIARATGAGDADLRRRLLGQGLFGVLVMAVLIMVAGLLLAPHLAGALGLTGETARQCTLYLRTLSLTVLPIAATPLVDQTFVSMGLPRAPMTFHAIALTVNVVLSPALIFGLDWGIVGAAVASTLSYASTSGMGLILLRRLTGLSLADVRPGPELRQILKIGGPIALGTALYTLVYWGMLKTSISPLGPEVNAALGIGFSALEGVSWPLTHGLALATAALVGQHLGAGDVDAAKALVRKTVVMSTALGLFISAAFYFGAGPLTGLFTDESAVHLEAIVYAEVLAASQLFVAWESLFEGVLSGAGHTRVVFVWSAPLNILRVPLAWWLAHPLGWGAPGVWWAINFTTWVKAIGKGWAVRKGGWATVGLSPMKAHTETQAP
ncbi:MAG: MATE family efflux transporter [Bradymonadia bacterium]